MAAVDGKKDKSDKVQNNDPSSHLTFWQRYEIPVMLTTVGGAIDTIGFIGLLGFFTNHVTGNLVMAGAGLVKGGDGLWVKLGALPVFLITVIITKRMINVADASGGTSVEAHQYAMERMIQVGVIPVTWQQVMLEWQRDWARKDTYDAIMDIVREHSGAYGMGVDYAYTMVHKAPARAAFGGSIGPNPVVK